MVRFLYSALMAALAIHSTSALPQTTKVSLDQNRLPLQFEANQGQTRQDVRFLSRGPGHTLYLTAEDALLVLQKSQGQIRMGLVNAEVSPKVSGLEELPGKANYFIGRDPSRWRSNVPTYGNIHAFTRWEVLSPAAFARNNGFRGCQRTPLARELLAKKILVRVDRRRSAETV